MTSWWRHMTFSEKHHFPKCYKHETWSVCTRWKENVNEHTLAGTWWRHDDVTWHFWKTHFPKCYKHETWLVCTRWKENVNEHTLAGTWWGHDDVTWLFWKTHFPKCYKQETGQYVLGEKKMWMRIRWQVPDDVMMTSRDISEKHTYQNAINMKLGQ